MRSMVKQTRIIFSPGDIVQMRLVCGECGGESSFPFSRTFDVPERCTYCLAEWWEKKREQPRAKEHALNLSRAIHYFLNPENAVEIGDLKFSIQMDIDVEQI